MNIIIGGIKIRRAKALQRLENQLIIGKKMPKGIKPIGYSDYQQLSIPLTDSDIKRINSEISILKSKI